jgi:nondiscriminating glutamyl-tRNA synthetase
MGNVRAAAFNWLFARHHDGVFVLRIEDTDVERNVEGGEGTILEDLGWLGLGWDEGPDVGGAHGPYRQSGRDAVYEATIQTLLAGSAAYCCFCSEEELEEEAEHVGEGRSVLRYSGRCRGLSSTEREERMAAGEPHVIRFAVPESLGSVEIEDEIFGSISVPISDVDDFVLRRSDGRVTYNFAVVADDVDMRISHVIRGVGHLSNTPKQALLFDALGATRPVFAHLPTVLGSDGRKLSKREGATAVAELRAEGYPPDAVLNYLSLLGWSHPEEKEVLTRDELVASIGLDRVGRSDAQMDVEKLRWMSSQHLATEPLDVLADHVRPYLDESRFPGAADRFPAVVDVLRTRLSVYSEINDHLPLLYPTEPSAASARRALGGDPQVRSVLEAVRKRLERSDSWDAEVLGAAVRDGGKDAAAKGAALFHPVRIALIGTETGPDLGKILAAVGREEALGRFDEALS